MTTKEFTKEYLDYLASRSRSVSTLKNTKTVLLLVEQFNNLSDVTIDAVESLVRSMRERGNKGQTINFKIERLAKAFDYAVDHGYTDTNPFEHFDRVNKDDARYRRDLTVDEIHKLLAASEGEYRCRWAVHLYTGLRATNVANLQWSWIDLENNRISIPRSEYKTNEDVTLPLHSALKEMLLEYRSVRDSKPVFKKKSLNAIRKMLRKHCELAGIDTEGVDLHALRHTFASSLLNAGTRIEVISKLLGHKNIATTQKYLHYDKATLEGGLELLPY